MRIPIVISRRPMKLCTDRRIEARQPYSGLGQMSFHSSQPLHSTATSIPLLKAFEKDLNLLPYSCLEVANCEVECEYACIAPLVHYSEGFLVHENGLGEGATRGTYEWSPRLGRVQYVQRRSGKMTLWSNN
jgi:hypothetical protein